MNLVLATITTLKHIVIEVTQNEAREKLKY